MIIICNNCQWSNQNEQAHDMKKKSCKHSNLRFFCDTCKVWRSYSKKKIHNCQRTKKRKNLKKEFKLRKKKIKDNVKKIIKINIKNLIHKDNTNLKDLKSDPNFKKIWKKK